MPSDHGAIRRWLTDIQHHIGMAQGFVAGINYETFRDDNLRLYAVTRCLENHLRSVASIARRTEGPSRVDRMA